MLEHIHCNKCFRIDPVKDISYWLTNCGHILCQQCLDHATAAQKKEDKRRPRPDGGNNSQTQEDNNGSESVCAICKKPCECINITEDVEDLPPAIQTFFQPLANLCNTTLDAWKFQEQNLTKLIDHLQARTKRQNEVLVKARTELLSMKAMKSENQTLKAENEKLKLQIKDIQRHQSGNGGNSGHRGGRGGGGAPITPVTPQIRVMNAPTSRVHPPTSPRNSQRPSAREEPAIANRAHVAQPQPQTDARTGGDDTARDPKRAHSTTSNVGGNSHGGRINMTPRLPTTRISLLSHQQPAFISPRLTLIHQPNGVLQSPRRPPSVHAVHQIAQPRYQTTGAAAHQLHGVALQQGPGTGDHIAAVPGGQHGYGYQQGPLPVQTLNEGHVYPVSQTMWPRADLAPGLLQVGVGYSAIPRTGPVLGGDIAGVPQDPLIRVRGSASTARTTWQQQQQQQQQIRQQKLQQQLQQQQHLQQQQQLWQQQQLRQQAQPRYGYPMTAGSAVPHPVVMRTQHG